MCKFFSAISDGKGAVKFFKPEDIAKLMSEGNKKNYDWNSHTSIAHYHGIEGREEDRWNKWEYDVDKKILNKNKINASDDSENVKKFIQDYLSSKNILYLRNLYNRNSGYMNSGDMNSGDMNSGNWNSGYWNSGNGNSGYWNSGDGVLNSFCTERKYLLFDEICSKEEYDKIHNLNYSWFEITKWIFSKDMTKKEKKEHLSHEVTEGYLKIIQYKEAWKKCPKEFIKEVKKLKNFNAKKFEQITGLKVNITK